MDCAREKLALLQSIRTVVSGDQEDHVDLESVDWSKVFNAARLHLVSGLVYEFLKTRGLEKSLPAEVRERFLYTYHLTGMRNEHIRRRLAEILSKAAREGAEVMLLKGPILAFSAYDRCEHRGMNDVDLVVREQDFIRLRKVLEGLGYRTSIPQLHSQDLPRYAHCYQQIIFQCRGGPQVETHFRLFNLGMPSPVELSWDDASPHEFAGVSTLCPSPEKFLLHLCLHTQQHAFSKLRFFVDIAVWCRSRKLDSERFVALAQQHHLSTAAFYALSYTADILGLPGVEKIRARLLPQAWKRRISEFLWRDRQVRSLQARLGSMETELPRAFLLGEAPFREKVVFLWNVLLPPKQWLTSVGGRRETRWSRLGRILVEARKGLTGT